nr:MAG TPA: hypothetical protein [Caudoviricetes sp.]
MNGVEHTPYLHSLVVFLLCHCGGSRRRNSQG